MRERDTERQRATWRARDRNRERQREIEKERDKESDQQKQQRYFSFKQKLRLTSSRPMTPPPITTIFSGMDFRDRAPGYISV